MTKTNLPIHKILMELAPAFRLRQTKGWFLAILCVGASFGAFSIMNRMNNLDPDLKSIPVIAGIASIFGVNRWVFQGKQQLIMPQLAQSNGLEYRQDGRAFFEQLPPRLLPKAPIQQAEDYLAGRIEDRDIAFCEVLLKSGGKHQKTRFRGYVLRFDNTTPMPAFFIAQLQKTNLIMGKINVSGLLEARRYVAENGIEYGVWLSESGLAKQDPALSGVLDILMSLNDHVQGDGQLLSATSSGEEIHVAVSHKPDLYRIGGLLASQQSIATSVEKAHADLKVPMQVATVLLEAEKHAVQMRDRTGS